MEINHELRSIVLGGGCFWCIQALFSQLKGVQSVQTGYAGGNSQNPTYEQLSKTNHTEVIKVIYNPKNITFKDLLYIFFHSHDATTKNKKNQYQSTIFFENQQDLKQIHSVLQSVQKEKKYPGAPQKIDTKIRKLDIFFKAQKKHQNYYETNKQKNNSYCQVIIKPNLSKFRQLFQKYTKK